ncbi:LOW QUALITY PROTEIN: N-acetyl-L,L-diaminopimelate deacetylase [Geomicrobium sp. JCM 19055]|nr:LOW QUALITY PROTEIN: N-acetyl-L,L-diaminopimelate deacetylase [Geomicrobium sp. JCM 19055]
MDTKQRANEMKEELIEWRRHIHQNPELGFEEVETQKFVEETLKQFGIPSKRVAKTGVIATIQGNSDGKTVALRLIWMHCQYKEDNQQLSYRSKRPGISHMCGHDAHTAMLLGAAKLLKENPPEHGHVKLVFQPAEEGLFGAKAMIEDGVLQHPKVEAIAGLHVYAKNEVGTISITPGLSSGAVDVFTAKIVGKGGHAAHPYLATDPITTAIESISSLQHIISRKVDPLNSAVLSITRIKVGTANNVIPNEVTFGGTIRTLEPEVRDLVEKELKRIIAGVTSAFGASFELDYQKGFPSVYNEPKLVPVLETATEKILGKESIHYGKPSMGGEDFSYYTNEIPGIMFRLGVGNEEKGLNASLHSSNFNIDEDALPLGSAILSQWAYDYLSK